MFAVKLTIFLMFPVSEENTVKCLEGSSDIFGYGRTSSLVFGNVRQSSGIVGSLQKSSEIIRKCRKMDENYTKQHWPFRSLFCFFLEKIYCFKEFFTVSVKVPKI